MAHSAPGSLLLRKPSQRSLTGLHRLAPHAAQQQGHARNARKRGGNQKARSNNPAPHVDTTAAEVQFQRRVELTRRQVQTALHRGNPEAAFGHLTAFAQHLQDAATPATLQPGSGRPFRLEGTSDIPAYQTQGPFQLGTRKAVGEIFRGLPRHIMQVCVEQVWHLAADCLCEGLETLDMAAIDCVIMLQDDLDLALAFMNILPQDPILLNMLLKVCIDRGDKDILAAALRVR